MSDLDLGECNACGEEPAVGVASVPGIPISIAWGERCLQERCAGPYDMLLTNLALAVFDEDTNWEDEDALRHGVREAAERGEIAPWALEAITYHDGEYKTMREVIG